MIEENKMQENKMGVLPINRLIFSMSFPAMISMIISAMYNIVESIFVARISEKAMTAVTLVFSVQMLQVSVAVGCGVGLSSFISRSLGAKRHRDAEEAATHGFIMAVFHWAIFACFGIFLAGPFIGLFTNDPYIYENAVLFCRIVTIGSLFSFVSITCERILQSMGNMLFPMIFNSVAAILNCFLAPVLILGLLGVPRLGVMGAGFAAVTCQFVGMCIALFLLFRFKHQVKPSFRGFKPKLRTILDIYNVGIPTMIMMSIGSFMISGLNAILIRFSAAAVAVLGVYFRLNSFIFMPVFGLNQGSLPIMGYNFGARNKDRLVKTYKAAVKIALVIMALGTALFWIAPHKLLALFSASDAMYEIGVPALRIISICFISSAFSIVTVGMFQALGHGFLSMLISLLRQLILILPLAWILTHTIGIKGAWIAFPIAEFSSLILTTIFLRHVYKKEIKDL
jgi:putative MATE family efflux protein